MKRKKSQKKSFMSTWKNLDLSYSKSIEKTHICLMRDAEDNPNLDESDEDVSLFDIYSLYKSIYYKKIVSYNAHI